MQEEDVYVSVGGMCEFLNQVCLTLKKTYRAEKVATEAGQQQQVDYRIRVQNVTTEKLIFIDKTAFWVGMIREIASSEKWQKTLDLIPFYKGTNDINRRHKY